MEETPTKVRHIIQHDSNYEYHGNKEYIGSSGLKLIYKKSPLHFFNQPEEKEPTAALLFGSAYHTYVLERDKFEQEYWVLNLAEKPNPTKDFRDSDNKKWKEVQIALNVEKTCLDSETMQQIKAMYEALTANPVISKILLEQAGEYELSHYTEIEGVKVKVRPDKLTSKAIIDLKTTEDASPEGFKRSAHEHGYHISAALYSDVLEQIYEFPRRFMFIAQEKKWPYVAQVYLASDAMLAQGRYEYLIALERYAEALETGISKGYEIYAEPEMQGILELDLPYWAYKA